MKPKPKDTSKAGDVLALDTTPTATWVTGSDGLVVSPFSNDGLVDVRGLSPGSKVKCPMTGKVFIVPQMSTEQKLQNSLKPYTEMFEGVEDPVDTQLRKLNTIQGPPSPQQHSQYRNLFDSSFSTEGQSSDSDKK